MEIFFLKKDELLLLSLLLLFQKYGLILHILAWADLPAEHEHANIRKY